MRLFLNDDVTGIEISAYIHNFNLTGEASTREEVFCNLPNADDLNTIADTWANVDITSVIIKDNNDRVIRTLSNVNFKLADISDTINLGNETIHLRLQVDI